MKIVKMITANSLIELLEILNTELSLGIMECQGSVFIADGKFHQLLIKKDRKQILYD